ncbi:MAG TPA: iron chelate uptake ABC transporter family permease subunit [Mycobacteriales bacterium]|nr:iron chelate uptake ABC transporter family permease subunit [Mycobacteriales bacterium]
MTVVALPGRAALRAGTASVVVRPRAAAVTGLLALIAVAVGCVAVSVGDYVVALPDVLRALVGLGEPGPVLVVQTLRLPRVLTGLLVGAAFGLAGALTQTVTRNPLASPDVVGLTTGASAAAVLALLVGLPVVLPVAAVLGGFVVAALLVALSWRAGFSGPRLVLVGIGLAAAGSALTDYLLVRAEIDDAQRAVVWLTGSLNGRGWEHVRPVALALLVLVPAALALGRGLSTLSLGDDVARALGVRVDRTRLAVVAVAVGLAGVATASAGPVLFVALVAPQVALRLARTPAPPLAASAAAGALLVVAADLVGRTGLSALGTGTELPVGAVTALVGAPVLLWLLRRSVLRRPA